MVEDLKIVERGSWIVEKDVGPLFWLLETRTQNV
jgi:hypothetical protein